MVEPWACTRTCMHRVEDMYVCDDDSCSINSHVFSVHQNGLITYDYGGGLLT